MWEAAKAASRGKFIRNQCLRSKQRPLINSPKNPKLEKEKHANAEGKITNIRTESKWKIHRQKSIKPRVDPLKKQTKSIPPTHTKIRGETLIKSEMKVGDALTAGSG